MLFDSQGNKLKVLPNVGDKVKIPNGKTFQEYIIDTVKIIDKISFTNNTSGNIKDIYEKQFKIKDYFRKNKNDNIYRFLTSKQNEFKSKVKGYVSVLNTKESSVKKNFLHKKVSDQKYMELLSHHQINYKSDMKFDMIPLSKLQQKVYNSKLNEYQTHKTSKLKNHKINFKDELKDISKFVFPDGSTNISKGKYVTTTDNSKKSKYILTDEFKKIIRANTKHISDKLEKQRQVIANISKFSSQFAYILETILDCYEHGKCMFIYSREIKSIGGIEMLSCFLELPEFGYKKASQKNTQREGKRFWLFTSNKNLSDDSTNAKLIKIFNDKKNVFGKYIHVIIGSDTASEGYSFNHIQHEIVMTPWYNFAKIEQILMRGIREGSHDILIRELKSQNRAWNMKVDVSLMVGFDEKNKESEELERYKRSIIKDKEIKLICRILKESSFDCYMFKNRNSVKNNVDFSRECDYVKCDYICDVEKDCKTNACDGKDLSTHNLYYTDFHNKYDKFLLEMCILRLFAKYYPKITDMSHLLEFLTIFFVKNISKKKLDKIKENIEFILGVKFPEDVQEKSDKEKHNVEQNKKYNYLNSIFTHNRSIPISILTTQVPNAMKDINEMIQKNIGVCGHYLLVNTKSHIRRFTKPKTQNTKQYI